jgi:hypothetical protein
MSKLVTHGNLTIEKNCCVEFANKKYCATGATLTEKTIFTYLSSDGLQITSWDGETVFSTEIRRLANYYNPFDIYGIDKDAFYLRFLYKDKVYSGIALGRGCYVKARVTKLKHVWS